MINFDHITKENIKEHNSNWLKILHHLNRILTNEGSGSEKNALLKTGFSPSKFALQK